MDPRAQESSSDDSTRSRSATPSSSTAPSSRSSSGGDALVISSGEDVDVKPSIKRARQGASLGGLQPHLRRLCGCIWRRSWWCRCCRGVGEEARGAGEEADGASRNNSSFTFCDVIDILHEYFSSHYLC